MSNPSNHHHQRNTQHKSAFLAILLTRLGSHKCPLNLNEFARFKMAVLNIHETHIKKQHETAKKPTTTGREAKA